MQRDTSPVGWQWLVHTIKGEGRVVGRGDAELQAVVRRACDANCYKITTNFALCQMSIMDIATARDVHEATIIHIATARDVHEATHVIHLPEGYASSEQSQIHLQRDHARSYDVTMAEKMWRAR